MVLIFIVMKDASDRLLEEGNKVVMINCQEGISGEGKIWVCESNPFLSLDSGRYVINLKGLDGNFRCDCLYKVNVAAFLEEERYFD